MDETYWGYGPDPVFESEFVVIGVIRGKRSMTEMADQYPDVIYFVAELVPA